MPKDLKLEAEPHHTNPRMFWLEERARVMTSRPAVVGGRATNINCTH